MANKALIVVDVLNDFMPRGALPIPNGDAAVEPTNKIIDRRKNKETWIVILVCDCHPEQSSHFTKYPFIV